MAPVVQPSSATRVAKLPRGEDSPRYVPHYRRPTSSSQAGLKQFGWVNGASLSDFVSSSPPTTSADALTPLRSRSGRTSFPLPPRTPSHGGTTPIFHTLRDPSSYGVRVDSPVARAPSSTREAVQPHQVFVDLRNPDSSPPQSRFQRSENATPDYAFGDIDVGRSRQFTPAWIPVYMVDGFDGYLHAGYPGAEFVPYPLVRAAPRYAGVEHPRTSGSAKRDVPHEAEFEAEHEQEQEHGSQNGRAHAPAMALPPMHIPRVPSCGFLYPDGYAQTSQSSQGFKASPERLVPAARRPVIPGAVMPLAKPPSEHEPRTPRVRQANQATEKAADKPKTRRRKSFHEPGFHTFRVDEAEAVLTSTASEDLPELVVKLALPSTAGLADTSGRLGARSIRDKAVTKVKAKSSAKKKANVSANAMVKAGRKAKDTVKPAAKAQTKVSDRGQQPGSTVDTRRSYGCWTCKVRRKKCTPVPNTEDCEACRALRLKCDGFSPVRPAFMSNPEENAKYRAYLSALVVQNRYGAKP